MKAVEVKIRGTDVLFGAFDDVEIVGRAGKRPSIKPMSVRSDPRDAYDAVKDVIRSVAEDVGEHLRSIDHLLRPKQAEMEFSVGFSTETKAIVVAAKGEAALKVKLTWDLTMS